MKRSACLSFSDLPGGGSLSLNLSNSTIPKWLYARESEREISAQQMEVIIEAQRSIIYFDRGCTEIEYTTNDPDAVEEEIISL